MAETIAGLVDRLTIVNLKLWAVQARVHQAARDREGLDADTVQKLASLNLDRNRLMAELDTAIDVAIRAGRAEVDPRVKIT